MKYLKYEHQSIFPLWVRVKLNFRDRYGKPNIYSKNSSHCKAFFPCVFTGLSKNDFCIILQTLTHPKFMLSIIKLCKLGHGDTPYDVPHHVGCFPLLWVSCVSWRVPCWIFEKLQIMPLEFGYLESSEKSEKIHKYYTYSAIIA